MWEFLKSSGGAMGKSDSENLVCCFCVPQKRLILWQRVVQDKKEAKNKGLESQNSLGWKEP